MYKFKSFKNSDLGINQKTLFPNRIFTFGNENFVSKSVNEGIAITGSMTMQAFGLENSELDCGFETSFSLLNQSGGIRSVDWSITNETKSTTLQSGTVSLGDGGFNSRTFFFSTEKIQNNDSIKFTYGGDGVGTAAGSLSFANITFKIKSIFLKRGE